MSDSRSDQDASESLLSAEVTGVGPATGASKSASKSSNKSSDGGTGTVQRCDNQSQPQGPRWNWLICEDCEPATLPTRLSLRSRQTTTLGDTRDARGVDHSLSLSNCVGATSKRVSCAKLPSSEPTSSSAGPGFFSDSSQPAQPESLNISTVGGQYGATRPWLLRRSVSASSITVAIMSAGFLVSAGTTANTVWVG